MYVFDIETNAIDFKAIAPETTATVIHCIVAEHMDTGEVLRFNDQFRGTPSIREGLEFLANAPAIGGHNIMGFDLPVIKHLYPDFKTPSVKYDSRVISDMVYGSDLRWMDTSAERKYGKWIPRNLFGLHSLESWGHRLGDYKDDYAKRCKERGVDPWAKWSQEMEDYCAQDVHVNVALFKKFEKDGILQTTAAWMEAEVAGILKRQYVRGFSFDEKAAHTLYAELAGERDQLKRTLRSTWFGDFYIANGQPVVPKRSMNRKVPDCTWKEEITEGAPYTKVKVVEFNPASRLHISKRLKVQYGWEPSEFTDSGDPKVDESILKGLPYPCAPTLMRYMMVNKRIGQLAEGDEAWLKHVNNGRIHGRIAQNGTRTGRMSHSKPNVAQVPRASSEYGKECRALFGPGEGYVQVGIDADGLEMRMQAHFLAKYDGGAYARAVVEGKKEDGTDAHTLNQKSIGLNSRDNGKTFFYALIYGAGDYKLGLTVYDDFTEEQRKEFGELSYRKLASLGKAARERLMKSQPALKRLVDAVSKAAKQRGYLKAIDGRRLRKVTPRVALNTLLQGNGAIVMKLAVVLLDKRLQTAGLVAGEDYEFVANVHDEWQIEVREQHAEFIGRCGKEAITEAGEFFKLRCRLDGSFDVGRNWSETH